MATPIPVVLQDTTSYLSGYTSTGSYYYKNVVLPTLYPSTIGRVVFFKEASEFPGVPYLNISSSGGNSIEFSTVLALDHHEAVTLQATQSSGTSYWSILNGYAGSFAFSTQQLPPALTVPVFPSPGSQLFVDLRTQSKVVVLPRIQTISQTSSSAFYMTIKDAYGWAATSTLYVSSSYGDVLEMSSINNSIRLNSNFNSIDLVANAQLSKWNIVNYYSGSLINRP